MDLAELEVFLTVTREGRFSRAAEKMHRTQSAVSQTIRKLEVELGEPLFDRQEPQLSSVIVYSDELSFVVPPSHPLAGSKEISIRQLGAETFVAHNVPSPYRDKVIDSFRKYKTPLHMDVELPTLQAIKRFVAMGNGVAFVPHISAETEIATGELVRIPVRELDLNRKLRLVYRKKASLSHAAQAFLKVAEAYAVERGGN